MRVTRVVDIQAAPERVFAVLCDVEHWPAWTATMERVTRTDQGPFIVGSRAKILQPKLKAAIWKVSELHPGRGFTWVSKGPGLRLTAGHQLEPIADGSRVTLSFAVSGWLKGIVLKFYGPLIESYVSTEAEGLKTYCETAAQSRWEASAAA